MESLKSVIIVLFIVLLGFLSKVLNVFDRNHIKTINKIVAKILLPIIIFLSLTFTEFTGYKFAIVGIFFAVHSIGLLLGFLFKRFFKNKYRTFLPFVVMLYEAGFIGYPLYTSLVGSGNLHNMVVIDIAGLLFGFSIFMSLLEETSTGKKPTVKDTLLSMLKSPPFIATVLGAVFSLTGVGIYLSSTALGGVLNHVSTLVSNTTNMIILIVAGYNMTFNKEFIKICTPAVIIRFVMQAILCAAVLLTVHALFDVSREMYVAIIVMMSCPGSFSCQSFNITEDCAKYIATVNSLYCIITLVIYVVMAVLI